MSQLKDIEVSSFTKSGNDLQGFSAIAKDDKSQILQTQFYGVFTKTLLYPGEGLAKPNRGSSCCVEITCGENHNDLYNREMISEHCLTGTNIDLNIGKTESDFLSRIEICIMSMRKGEVSAFSFVMTKNQIFTSDSKVFEGDAMTQIHCGQNLNLNSVTIMVTLTLHSFTYSSPSWNLSSREKYGLALSLKERGTELFKEGNISAAFICYSQAVKYTLCIPEISIVSETDVPNSEETGLYLQLKCLCYLNLAACQIKVGNHQGVINNCTQALSLDCRSVKALYRRAMAHLAVGQKDWARADLLKAKQLEPRNKAVLSLLQSLSSK